MAFIWNILKFLLVIALNLTYLTSILFIGSFCYLLFSKNKYEQKKIDVTLLKKGDVILTGTNKNISSFYIKISNLLTNGMDWLEEECQTTYNRSFINLSSEEKDKIFRTIEKSNWGYRWLSLNLIYIFEALWSDPIYGGNTDEIGWKWLEHVPGLPRPTADNIYGKLWTTIMTFV